MIDNLLIVALIDGVLLLGFAYGYYLGKSNNSAPLDKANAAKVRTKLAFRGSVIDYPSQADIDYRDSGEEAVDRERERVFREQFKP